MSSTGYTRIYVQVPRDLYDEFRRLVPWGIRIHLFGSLLRLLMSPVRADGWERVLSGLMAGEYELTLIRDRRVDRNSIDARNHE